MSDIETRLLRYFVAVAEERHFGGASERLGITPPTLTQQIQKLERQLGTKLMKRKGNTKIVITQAGQRFLSHARDVLGRLEEGTAAAQQAGRGELGRLEVGCLALVSSASFLQSWVGAFEQAHPAIEIKMRKLVSMAQLNGIARKKLDAGFVRAPQKYPAGVRGFEIYRHPMMLALPSKHPLARHKTISPALLSHEAFISITPDPDIGYSDFTEVIARIGDFVPRIAKRDDDLNMVLLYVALGHGIAVVPGIVKTVTISNVVFRNIAADPVPHTSIAFVYGSDPSPSTNLLIQHMRRRALRGGGTPPNGSAGPKDAPKSALQRAA